MSPIKFQLRISVKLLDQKREILNTSALNNLEKSSAKLQKKRKKKICSINDNFHSFVNIHLFMNMYIDMNDRPFSRGSTYFKQHILGYSFSVNIS
jgi:hypothetical protein